jgi:hypothetical protein
MSRIELAGVGGPIPTVALPDPNVDDNFPSVVLQLNDGEPFVKFDWEGVGYTHYEVWVVGACGGVGGRTTEIRWDVDTENRYDIHIPDAVWNAAVALRRSYLYTGPGTDQVWVEGRYVPYGQWNSQVWEPLVPARWMTDAEHLQYINPTHNGYVVIWEPADLQPSMFIPGGMGVGGGGGGGGVCVGSGLLADLPAAVPVVVGHPGADGAMGQAVDPSPTYVPQPPRWADRTNYMLGMWEDMHYFSAPADLAKVATVNNWGYLWPLPHSVLPPPAPGADGGASSFGGIVDASGGKGGHSAIKWVGAVKSDDQVGGDGGVGGQSAAGGGGLGSTARTSAGKDGTWDGVIGQGGGGGFGGKYNPGGGGLHGDTPVVNAASNGGQGSYSFADTSVFGVRQYKQTMTDGSASAPIIPGGGGGVRANHTTPAGSKATGYSPDGAVLIRIFKVDS